MKTLRYLILGCLRSGSPNHGYGVMKLYLERSGIALNLGNVYREMAHLTAEGLIHRATNPPGMDARRVPYQITATGAAALDAWLGATARVRLAVCDDELSRRVAFLHEADPKIRARVMAWWRDALGEQMAAAERARHVAMVEAHRSTDARCRALQLSRRLRHLTADLDLIDAVGAPSAIRDAAWPLPGRCS